MLAVLSKARTTPSKIMESFFYGFFQTLHGPRDVALLSESQKRHTL